MFRWYKIWRAENGLAEAQAELYSWGHNSVELQNLALGLIVHAKRQSDEHEWTKVQLGGEANEHLYKLFLHQQNIGLLVENVRKKAYALGRLKPSLAKKLWEIGEDLGVRGNISQHELYENFVKNLLPRLEQVESEMFPESGI